jgi:cyclin T
MHFFYLLIAEVSNQMLELYEQNRVVQSQPTHGNEAEGSSAIVPNQGISVKAQAKSEEPPVLGHHQASKQSDSNHSTSTGVPIHNGAEDSDRNKQINSQRSLQNVSGDHGIDKTSCQSGVGVGAGINDGMHDDTKSLPGSSRSSDKSDIPMEEQKPFLSHASSCETRDGNLNSGDVPSVSSSMMDAMNKIDKDKVKAALEKQRRLKGDVARNVDVMDDEDLLESELERGVELTVEDEKIKSGDVAENGDHGEQNVPEAEVLVDVKEECSPAKSNDGFEQVPEPS